MGNQQTIGHDSISSKMSSHMLNAQNKIKKKNLYGPFDPEASDMFTPTWGNIFATEKKITTESRY